MTADRVERIIQAARHACGAIEDLLDLLGWSADERALSLALDRLR